MKKLLAASLILSGCQHQTPTVFIREVPVQVASNPALDVIRFPAAYKAYTVGRRPDPSNPNAMHEAHILYVRQAPERWNLHPAPASASTNTTDSPFSPLPLSEQLRLELQKQENVSRSLAEQTQRFQQTTDELLPATRKAAELISQVHQKQQSIEDRLRRLEDVQRPVPFSNLNSTNR